jgi:hypothetical protein
MLQWSELTDLYIWSSTNQKDKSTEGVISGERGGQKTGPNLPADRLGKVAFSHGHCEQKEDLPHPVKEL